jgi:hypothetical protein
MGNRVLFMPSVYNGFACDFRRLPGTCRAIARRTVSFRLARRPAFGWGMA